MRQKQVLKIGDFVCTNNQTTHHHNMKNFYWQAIGRVVAIEYNTKKEVMYTVDFPDADHRGGWFYREYLRRASAYEGMMAFWDPEEETKRFFASHSTDPLTADDIRQANRVLAAKQKADQRNVTAEDL